MTYNGPTIITNGGTLVLAVDDAMPAGSDLVLGGGTFLVDVENYNADSSLSMGTLTLTANSTIDLGGFGTSGDRNLVFANSSGVAINWATNAVLTISNWQGVAQTQSEVTKLLFGVGGLDSDQLAQIQFAGFEQGAVLVSGRTRAHPPRHPWSGAPPRSPALSSGANAADFSISSALSARRAFEVKDKLVFGFSPQRTSAAVRGRCFWCTKGCGRLRPAVPTAENTSGLAGSP